MDAADLAPGPGPQIPIETFVRRRARLADRLEEDQVLVVATHPPAQYSNDVEYPFRPHSDFWYLTGCKEPHATLVLDASGTSTLFLQERKPEAEVWTGRRLGVDRAHLLQVDRAYPESELARRLPDLVDGRRVLGIVAHAPEVAARLPGEPEDAGPLVAQMRVRKDAEEIRMLRKAAEVGVEAHRAAATRICSGAREFEVEAALLETFRRNGSDGPGYPPIVGRGPNAAVLHYITNQDLLRPGDAVLVDAGCGWGYYTSDITRTYPVDGAWDDRARDLYDVVRDAHRAALKEVRPGNRFKDPHEAACRVLAQGLVDLGVLQGDADSVLQDGTYKRHFMHGTSHFLGLDVHDAGNYKEPDGDSRVLEEGMVLTVEPGLYFNPDFAACPEAYTGIGIRIEDDVVVGPDGPEVLTAALPTDADAVAELVQG